MLDSLDDFIAACVKAARVFAPGRASRTFEAGDLYCPTCAGPRRMTIEAHRVPAYVPTSAHEGLNVVNTSTNAIASQIAPMVFSLTCVQSKTPFTALLFRGPEGFELAVFPGVRGGLTTSNTPAGVAYYLDQAQRSQSAGANSAAVSMYRAALEHLLFDQGYTVRMLGPKLAALDQAISDNTAPKWALDLDRRFLAVLNRLGSAAIHPGDGDVSKQAALDSALLQQVKITFAELLRLVYERDKETTARLDALEAALAAVEAIGTTPNAPARST